MSGWCIQDSAPPLGECVSEWVGLGPIQHNTSLPYPVADSQPQQKDRPKRHTAAAQVGCFHEYNHRSKRKGILSQVIMTIHIKNFCLISPAWSDVKMLQPNLVRNTRRWPQKTKQQKPAVDESVFLTLLCIRVPKASSDVRAQSRLVGGSPAAARKSTFSLFTHTVDVILHKHTPTQSSVCTTLCHFVDDGTVELRQLLRPFFQCSIAGCATSLSTQLQNLMHLVYPTFYRTAHTNNIWYCSISLSDLLLYCIRKTSYCSIGLSDLLSYCTHKTWYCRISLSDLLAYCMHETYDDTVESAYPTFYHTAHIKHNDIADSIYLTFHHTANIKHDDMAESVYCRMSLSNLLLYRTHKA